MSHISTYKTIITDSNLLCKIAERKKYTVIKNPKDTFMFGNMKVENANASIHLPGWRYPIAIKNQEILYDHFGSPPETINRLGEILQEYNKETIINNLPIDQIQNYTIEELKNGDMKLNIVME